MYNIYYFLIISFVLIFFIFDKFVDYLNTLNWSDKIPWELLGIYDEEKYLESQKYEKVKHKFSNISSIFSFLVTILVLIFGWFWFLDNLLRNYISNQIILWLAFFWVISFLQTLIWLPFSYYQTFVIEEKFGFNKSSKKIFFLDVIKSLLLTFVIWWLLLALIIWIYTIVWVNFWYYAWIMKAKYFMVF